MKIQSDFTDVCGQYCLVFLHSLDQGNSLEDFQRIFTSDALKNDTLISQMAKTIALTKNAGVHVHENQGQTARKRVGIRV